MGVQVLARAEALSSFSPFAVERGCAEWGRTQSAWPSVAKLVAMVEDHQALVNAEQERRRAIPGPSGESWPDRLERLLGRDTLQIGAGHIGAVMSLRDDAARMSDQEVTAELRWILERGYRWRPEPAQMDAAAASRVATTTMHMRREPSRYGGHATVECLCRIGEAMMETAP